MQRKIHGQMSESFLIAGILSISGGLQDAYTYMYRGKVFANAQTGNIVLLAQNLVDRNWQAVLRYFSPLLFFALGVAMAECIRMKYQKAQKIHWRQLVLAIEILLLFAVGFIPNEIDLLANAMVSFACAMQVQAFRKVNGYAFASTMCIGNLRSGMESLCAYGKTKIRLLFRNHLLVCCRRGIGWTYDRIHRSENDLDFLYDSADQLFMHVHQGRKRGTSRDHGRRTGDPG